MQQGKVKIDRNMTLGELDHSRSPLGWLIWLVLTALLKDVYKRQITLWETRRLLGRGLWAKSRKPM